MQPQGQLALYTEIAKKVIYNGDRIKHFAKMMGTEQGAVTAAQTVVAAIDKVKPVPPEIAQLLAINAYMLIVDVLQEATHIKPDNAIMKRVVADILSSVPGAQQPDQPGPENQETEQEPDADEGVMPRKDQPGPESKETEQEPDEDDNVVTRLDQAGPENQETEPEPDEDDNVVSRMRRAA